jgi:signal transduction histidine kinase
MHIVRQLRLPRRTARLRLTALYGGLFLVCGIALLAITYLLFERAVGGGKPLVDGAVRNTGSRPLPPPPKQYGVARVIASRQADFDLRQLQIQSGIALGLMTAAAAVLGWVVAGRVLRPLATITAAAKRISASSLHERLKLQGPHDELRELGDTLDDLFARLEGSFQAQRHFVANASHELRTPVTRERTLLQVARADPDANVGTWQAVSQDLLASNTEQERLIEALLTLASSEAGLDRCETVDLTAITDEVVLARRPLIGHMGLHLSASTGPAGLDGDPVLIRRLVTNLVDNSLLHNIADGCVEISTRTNDGHAVLSVANSGPVIPPGEVDRLFQPFQRLSGRRAGHGGGHGLGLSIVRAIAGAHGAFVAAQAPREGGLAISVAFPWKQNGPAPAPSRGGNRAGHAGAKPGQNLGDDIDPLGLLSPVALRDLELDALALFKGPVPVGLDR